MLTETEAKYVGVDLAYSILFGRYDEHDDLECEAEDDNSYPKSRPKKSVPEPREDSARLRDATKAIAGVKSKLRIRDVLVYKLMREATDAGIARYLVYEKIPAHYHALINSDACIEILIRGIFYKVCKLRRTPDLDLAIDKVSAEARSNNAALIPYERVGILQTFVHQTVKRVGGELAYRRIKTEHMRCMLSVCRLYLNILDLVGNGESYAVYIDRLSNAEAEFECFNPSPASLPKGKNFIPKWRARHMRPLSHFFPRLCRDRISAIMSLDESLPWEKYSQSAARIFSQQPPFVVA